MAVYYNEIDPFAAQWLRNLIAAGHLPAGDVDERDIREVSPDDLRPYVQAHFFAGIGGWPHALRLAGWPDDRPVWTGSCPCQPLSSAGQRKGHADERHLWPAFYRLIAERRPATVFGEQVASRDGREWLAAVRSDLEPVGYAVGAADLPVAGIGAPHIRQRLFFVAHAVHAERRQVDIHQKEGRDRQDDGRPEACRDLGTCGEIRGMGDPGATGLPPRQRPELPGALGHDQGRAAAEPSGASGGVGNAERLGARRNAGAGSEAERGANLRPECDDAGSPGPDGGLANPHVDRQPARRLPIRPGRQVEGEAIEQRPCENVRPGPLHGFWRDADWLLCRDGKWRPVEPGTFPLAHGIPGRVGRLRAYANAIEPHTAAAFVRAGG